MKAFDAQSLHRKLSELLALPAETEWLEFKKAARSFHFDKLGQYFSALSNEARLKRQEAGWLIFGVQDHPRKIVGSDFRRNRADLDNLKKEIADQTSNRLTFIEIHELHLPEGRVVMFEIPPARPGEPTAWKGHYYGRDGESIGPLNPHEHELIRLLTQPDWSGEICPNASLTDLDPAAIARARELFKAKYPNLAAEVEKWKDETFLNKAKVLKSGKITTTAIILLGREEAEYHLESAIARISWILRDQGGMENDYQHFGPPFLLNSDRLFNRIRNLTYRYMRDHSLFPVEITQYDAWVIRELLHNCIAHQDYALRGRINVVEDKDSLLFVNGGSFLPESVENVIRLDAPPEYYRNQFLADAMVNLQMIDTIGSGIKRIFNLQRSRFFPMPDYDLSAPQRVKVRLLGKILDENYTRFLMTNTDLGLFDVIALDKVQKKYPLSNEEFSRLKKLKLVEGRRPNLFVAARIAEATHGKVDYIRYRAFDKAHYKKMVIAFIKKFGSASRSEIDNLLYEKLPDILSHDQKKNKIRNLLQEMSKNDRSIRRQGGPGRHGKWILVGD
jgi:ATP-dependent DNA helicase RecG